MKYVIVFALLFLSASGHAQAKVKVPDWKDIVDAQVFGKSDTAWIRGDTVEFGVNTSVKFIKIGDDVYQVVKHNPTLEKVQAITSGNGFFYPPPGTRFNLNNLTVPAN